MIKIVWSGKSAYNIYISCKNMWLGDVDTKLQMVPESSGNDI